MAMKRHTEGDTPVEPKKGPQYLNLGEDEVLLQCPYDPSHYVIDSRFVTHLIKCRRNYLNRMRREGDLVHIMNCKYNWLHHLPAPEILLHERNCPAKYNVMAHVVRSPLDNFDHIGKQKKNGGPFDKFLLYFAVGWNPDNLQEEECDQWHTGGSLFPGEQLTGYKRRVWPNTKENAKYLARMSKYGEDWEDDLVLYNPMNKLKELNFRLNKYPPNLTKSERRKWKEENVKRTAAIMSEDHKPIIELPEPDSKSSFTSYMGDKDEIQSSIEVDNFRKAIRSRYDTMDSTSSDGSFHLSSYRRIASKNLHNPLSKDHGAVGNTETTESSLSSACSTSMSLDYFPKSDLSTTGECSSNVTTSDMSDFSTTTTEEISSNETSSSLMTGAPRHTFLDDDYRRKLDLAVKDGLSSVRHKVNMSFGETSTEYSGVDVGDIARRFEMYESDLSEDDDVFTGLYRGYVAN